MKKIISAFLALLISATCFSATASATKQLGKVNITLNTDIAGLSYMDYDKVFSIDDEDFEFAVAPNVGSAMVAYYDGRAYRGDFEVGETYQLAVQFSFPSDVSFTDEFAICLNGEELDPSQYSMLSNPQMGIAKLVVNCEVTVTEKEEEPKEEEPKEEDFFTKAINAIKAFFEKIIDAIKGFLGKIIK